MGLGEAHYGLMGPSINMPRIQMLNPLFGILKLPFVLPPLIGLDLKVIF